MTYAVCFTNFGPYHLARLRALALALRARGDSLLAYELAGNERRYPWLRSVGGEPFDWVTLFPDDAVESIPPSACRVAMRSALDRDRPDAVGAVGYARPESMAMLRWARELARPAILMSESQEIDHPRTWWKEAVKRRRVSSFSSGLVGGPTHADYLETLGLPRDRIAYGYNAVDHEGFARAAGAARLCLEGRSGLPSRPYFIAVNRFVPEKNLVRLVEAYALYRSSTPEEPWDLVLCGDGPDAPRIDAAIASSGHASSIHRPGFLQAEALSRWLAFATGFVHPSLMEPWGLVANEAAACGLPLLLSSHAGCARTLIPESEGQTGRIFDPTSIEEIAASMEWLATRPEVERADIGRRAERVAAAWGPGRFAAGTIEALAMAAMARTSRRPRRAVASGETSR